MFSSPLRRAITRGMKPDGNLADELRKLDDYSIRSRKDAKAICEALRKLPVQPGGDDGFSSPLRALASLFQDVEGRDAPAFDVMNDEGLPELLRFFDAMFEAGSEADADDLLFLLKIFAMYGLAEGAERIVAAAQRPLKPDAYMWHVVLSMFAGAHPHRDLVFDALSDPLPPDFLGVALLDSANGAAMEGELDQHPFDSEAGWKQLEQWLEDRDSENFSYAHSATASLPFMSNPAGDRLLALAMDHVDPGVQMEAAWAAGKLGREAGLKILTRFCLDVNHSDVAQRYLAELDRDDMIPEEAKDASFQAKAEFARWLAHPNELGRAPDELEIVDHRVLAWPPLREPQPFWLIRYRLRDQTGLKDDDVDCGLVGSATWCFFCYRMHERPPEDAYAIHCYWEMEHANLIAEVEVTDASEYAEMLLQWQGAPLTEPRVTRVADLSPELKCHARLVAVASAEVDGEEGWVVLDGSRSAWYPKAEQPEEGHESIILKIHVGRQLLGFAEQPDRKNYLVTERPRRDPREILEAYERFMAEAADCTPERQKELLGCWSLLSRHYDKYIEALAEVNGTDQAEAEVGVYRRFLELAERADESVRDAVHEEGSVLGRRFDRYVDALVTLDRSVEIAGALDLFAPHWDSNLGYSLLGGAAFKAGQRDVAEGYFMKLREEMEEYYSCEEMSWLAEIWHDRGEVEETRELLIDCLRKLVSEIEESKYNSDRKQYAEEYQHHRSTYLRLFANGEEELGAAGIPVKVE